MKTLKVINGALVRENGRLVEITGAEALAQRLTLALRLDLGSWFLDTSKGVDWFGIYDDKFIYESKAREEVEKVLLADSEVTGINYIEVTMNNAERELSIAFGVSSVYGDIEETI